MQFVAVLLENFEVLRQRLSEIDSFLLSKLNELYRIMRTERTAPADESQEIASASLYLEKKGLLTVLRTIRAQDEISRKTRRIQAAWLVLATRRCVVNRGW